MSQVVALNGESVPHRTLAEQAHEAKVALRHLLDAIEAGEIAVDGWLFLYDIQSKETAGNLACANLDSGLTVAEATYMAQNFIFDTSLRVRGIIK